MAHLFRHVASPATPDLGDWFLSAEEMKCATWTEYSYWDLITGLCGPILTVYLFIFSFHFWFSVSTDENSCVVREFQAESSRGFSEVGPAAYVEFNFCELLEFSLLFFAILIG